MAERNVLRPLHKKLGYSLMFLFSFVILLLFLSLNFIMASDSGDLTEDSTEEKIIGNNIESAGCIVPRDGMTIRRSMTFCRGNYYLPKGINITGSNIKLNCNSSVLTGKYRAALNVVDSSFVKVRNCFISNASIYVDNSDNVLVTNIFFHYGGFGIWSSHNISILKSTAWSVRAYYSDNITISDNTLTNNDHAIYLYRIYNSHITRNLIENYPYWGRGISLDGVSNNVFQGNNLLGYGYGIYCWYECSFNTFKGNTIQGNILAIGGRESMLNSTFYRNNFISNTQDIQESLSRSNTFSHKREGNYWSKYDNAAEGCVDGNSNGICDSPYLIPGVGKDYYPFTSVNGWLN